MKIAELARRAGVAATAVRWYEQTGVLPAAERSENGYREYGEVDLARLRLVVTLRRLGLGPEDAGRLARLCLEHGTVDLDLAPLIAAQRAALARQRDDLERLDAELTDLELTIEAAARVRDTTRETTMSDQPIRVLFVCTGNSARSQIGQALLAHLGGPEFAVESAGTEPKGVNPYAVRVLAEVGIDWSGAQSKPLAPFLEQPFDYVITVCDRARQACPV
ncbi:MAG: MerR family transcriptional regulator, partial [Candidatus Limnocylindrales bacterium]